MRVVHLACVAPPESGGMGQAAFDEVMGLQERGIEASLVSSSESASWRRVSGIGGDENKIIKRLPTLLRIGNAALVRRLDVAMADADIIHLHYPWYGVAEPLLWKRPKKPVVVTFHMDATAEDWRGTIFSLHRRFLQSRLLRHASRVLVTSRDYAEHSSLAPLLSDLGDNVIELPFGLDTDFFSPAPELLTTHYSLLTPSTVLFVGGLDKAHHFKGLSILLQALVRSDPSVRLSIIGEGDERPAFERQVNELGLTARVTFQGRVTREALRDAYRTALVLAFPSTNAAEAFGLVALEAQACGLPVIASCLPGVRTVVRDGETGILVTPGSVEELAEAMDRIRRDKEKYGILAKNARERAVEVYSFAKHIDKLQGIYQAL